MVFEVDPSERGVCETLMKDSAIRILSSDGGDPAIWIVRAIGGAVTATARPSHPGNARREYRIVPLRAGSIMSGRVGASSTARTASLPPLERRAQERIAVRSFNCRIDDAADGSVARWDGWVWRS
jgi:hypothetical protein